jgi:hypothetical protein
VGNKSQVPAAPNTAPISAAQSAAATANSATGAQQLQWAQNQGVSDQATTDHAVSGALGQQDALNAQSKTDLNTYNSTATPALKTLQTDANNYSNPGFRDQQVAQAQGAVATADEAARHNSTQQLEGYGINPASTRMGAIDLQARTQQGADEAAAGTNMGQTVDATGRALQQQVFTDASGVGAAGVNASTAGTGAGASAVNSKLATTQTGAQTQGTNVQYQGIAANDLTGSANTANQTYANEIAATTANNSASSGIGSAVGLVGGVALKAALKSEMGGPITAIHAAVGGPTAGPDATPGGAVPAGASPTGGKGTDDVPARLTVGEYIIPKDVTAWLGHKHFQSLIDKSREQAAAATAKPAVGNVTPQAPTVSSTPRQGAIPMSRAA